jgi:hypothetical protein
MMFFLFGMLRVGGVVHPKKIPKTKRLGLLLFVFVVMLPDIGRAQQIGGHAREQPLQQQPTRQYPSKPVFQDSINVFRKEDIFTTFLIPNRKNLELELFQFVIVERVGYFCPNYLNSI